MNTFELLGYYLSSTPDYSQYIPGALKAPQSDRLAQSCNSAKHVWDESQFPWYVYVPAHLYSFWDSKLYSLDFSVILSTKRNYVYSIIIKIHRKIVIYFHYFSLFFSFFSLGPWLDQFLVIQWTICRQVSWCKNKIRASDKDLPLSRKFNFTRSSKEVHGNHIGQKYLYL